MRLPGSVCSFFAAIVATAACGTVAAAELRLVDPTERYPHGVFGQRFEYAAVEGACGKLTLPAPDVFEDRRLLAVAPNEAGEPRFLTMIANGSDGARLAIINLGGGCLPAIEALSEPVGTGYRWRNPIGLGDFDGDGTLEVASIQTPHIGGILQLHEIEGERLVKRESLPGYSNHRFGEQAQGLGAVVTLNGRSLVVVPTQSRDVLALLGFDGAKWQELGRRALNGQVQNVTADGRGLTVTVGGRELVLDAATNF